MGSDFESGTRSESGRDCAVDMEEYSPVEVPSRRVTYRRHRQYEALRVRWDDTIYGTRPMGRRLHWERNLTGLPRVNSLSAREVRTSGNGGAGWYWVNVFVLDTLHLCPGSS